MRRGKSFRLIVFFFSLVVVFYGVVSEAPHTDGGEGGFRFAKTLRVMELPNVNGSGSTLGARSGKEFCFACYLGPFAVSTPAHPNTFIPWMRLLQRRGALAVSETKDISILRRSRGPPIFPL